jgi:hypothetical protein
MYYLIAIAFLHPGKHRKAVRSHSPPCFIDAHAYLYRIHCVVHALGSATLRKCWKRIADEIKCKYAVRIWWRPSAAFPKAFRSSVQSSETSFFAHGSLFYLTSKGCRFLSAHVWYWYTGHSTPYSWRSGIHTHTCMHGYTHTHTHISWIYRCITDNMMWKKP